MEHLVAIVRTVTVAIVYMRQYIFVSKRFVPSQTKVRCWKCLVAVIFLYFSVFGRGDVIDASRVTVVEYRAATMSWYVVIGDFELQLVRTMHLLVQRSRSLKVTVSSIDYNSVIILKVINKADKAVSIVYILKKSENLTWYRLRGRMLLWYLIRMTTILYEWRQIHFLFIIVKCLILKNMYFLKHHTKKQVNPLRAEHNCFV